MNIFDGRKAFYQWDTNRKIRLNAPCQELHIGRGGDETTIDVKVLDSGGDYYAEVPDEILQDAAPFIAYGYVTTPDGNYTRVQQRFAVIAHEKPAGYIYTPAERLTWAQLQAQIGDLSNLTTEVKTSLVAAINEAALSGGGTGIESITYKGEDESGGNMYTVLLTDGTSYDITAPKGAKGDKGADGKTPVKGTDYWTAADKREIIDDIHPAYYIDLEGEYPNYTCPVAMADIKAAYEAGQVLECRCAMGQYTATLPLFIPMPSANTWIFSGAGALAAMNFPAQSLTIAIVNGTVQASNTRLASMADIPTIPATLPNPNALTVKIGSTTVTYDGSSAQTVEIADGTEVAY